MKKKYILQGLFRSRRMLENLSNSLRTNKFDLGGPSIIIYNYSVLKMKDLGKSLDCGAFGQKEAYKLSKPR